MSTQQQEQQPEFLQKHRSKRPLWRRWLIASVILILMVVGIIIWILTSRNAFTAILPIVIFTVLGVLIALFQWLFPVSSGVSEHTSTHQHALQVPPIIVHIPTTQPLHEPTSHPDKASHRGIVGIPPPTDPRTIQQREHMVREVYTRLIQTDITAIALTGIGGVGKSTLAALIYRYVEEQRQAHTSLFQAETLWFTIDPAATFADLAGNLFEALGKPFLDLNNLAPQNQAVALFNALNTTDKPRLVIVDQFENLLDWNTGHALTDRPGVGEWLDMLNSQRCNCRILLTSRPRPVGTREYPQTYLQEFPVRGLEPGEGIALLRNQGVQATDEELQIAVSYCAGHAFSLTLLASLLRDHHLDLTALFKQTSLWTGDIATNLLDQIYQERLDNVQRELLLAFSVYREPVPFEAAQAVITNVTSGQLLSALKVLVTQRLLDAVGGSRYQLHAIIAGYAQTHINESNEQANEETLLVAHTRAAQYYLEQASKNCPQREKRVRISDVHDLIEAVWQFCQAENWQKAYKLIEHEYLFVDRSRWGGYAVLQELYELFLPLDKWDPGRSQEARICYDLGNLYRVIGKTEQAREYLEQALSLYREVKDRSLEGWVLRDLGRVFGDRGNIKQANDYYEAALTIHKELRDAIGEGVVLTNLGWVYYITGQLENARQNYEKALVIYKNMHDQREESNTLNNLGRVYRVMGEKVRAKTLYEQALTINREEGDLLGEGWSLHNLGKVYNDLGQHERALECLEQALRVRRRLGELRGEGGTLEGIGRVYLSLGELEQAYNYYELGLRISKEIGDFRGEANALNNLGKVCSKLGQRIQAIKYFRQAYDIRRKVKDRTGVSSTLYYFGIFCFGQSQYDVALSCFLLDKQFLDEVQHPYRDETLRWIEKIHYELGDQPFNALLTTVEPESQKIVDQALGES